MARPDYAVNFSEQVRAWTLSTKMECQSLMHKYQPRSFFTTCSVRMLVVSNFGENAWGRADRNIRIQRNRLLLSHLKFVSKWTRANDQSVILFICYRMIPPLRLLLPHSRITTYFTSWLLHFICFVNIFNGNNTKDLDAKKVSYIITTENLERGT